MRTFIILPRLTNQESRWKFLLTVTGIHILIQVHIFLKINHAVYIDNEENIFCEI